MRILVSGASGLIGAALLPALREHGHDVRVLVRRPPRTEHEFSWDPASRSLDDAVLADVDAVVNLSGAGIGDRRWTAAYKRQLVSSRLDTTGTLAAALARLAPTAGRPLTLINASAVGWYGDTGTHVVDERSPAGEDFLADLCVRWEAATRPASDAGVRVVQLRNGLVFSRQGGLLGRLRPIFALGLGAPLGTGRQYWPLVSLADATEIIRFVLTTQSISGPVNVCIPEQVDNRTVTKLLAAALHRPAVPVPVPGPALRLALGEFARLGVLTGQRVAPRVLMDSAFAFRHPTAEAVLRWAADGSQG